LIYSERHYPLQEGSDHFVKGQRVGQVAWALAVAAIQVVSAAQNFPGLITTPTWDAVFAAAGIGLTLTAPVLAMSSAAIMAPKEHWIRRAGMWPALSMLTRWWHSVWLILAAATGTYFALIAMFAWNSSPTFFAIRSLVNVVAFIAATVTMSAIGAILGAVLLTAVAVTVAALGTYAFVAVSLTTGIPVASNLLGLGLSVAPLTISTQSPFIAALPPLFLAITLVLVLWLSGNGRRSTSVAVLLTTAGLVLGGVVAQVTPFPTIEPRAVSELQCNEQHVCLWPELDSERTSLDRTATTLVASLDAAHIKHPTRITNVVVYADWPRSATPTIEWAVEPGMSRSESIAKFAVGVQRSATCDSGAVPSELDAIAGDRALLALAAAWGANLSSVTNELISDRAASLDSASDATLNAAFDLPTSNDIAIYAEWAESEKPCR
jgi:hypothetical protein